MLTLSVLGVTRVSDLYPNVKHKIQLIAALPSIQVQLLLHDLGSGGFYQGIRRRNALSALAGIWQLCWGTLSVFARYLTHRTDIVYIAYPAPALAILVALLPGKYRPVIYLDAFISLYDTAVVDRGMCAPGSWKARLLFAIERRAFAAADGILVDTADNADYYAALFQLPRARFHVVPLSIPPLQRPASHADPVTATTPERKPFTCLFLGSLVPLHGIETILATAARLAHEPELRFVIIGDGQEGWRLERFLRDNPRSNVTWHKGLFATGFVVEHIVNADLCLGIFGHTDKTQRVLPYKIYYYAALAKAFVTLRTPCLERYCGADGDLLLCDTDPQSPRSLDAAVLRYLHDRTLLARAALASGELYRRQLGPDAINTALGSVLNRPVSH
ncbi:MAG TPA: glycosyltransferase [Candidatus Acidoferrum sp.]|nr:glycosyltransferase [Candidatus Acidoferrum sp.]